MLLEYSFTFEFDFGSVLLMMFSSAHEEGSSKGDMLMFIKITYGDHPVIGVWAVGIRIG